MRKNRLYITIAGLLMFTSCGEDYLQTHSYTELNESTFFKTPTDAYNALVGVYDGFQRMYTAGFAVPTVTEVFSDNAFGGGGASDGYGGQLMDEFDQQKSPSDIKILEDDWINYYKGIFRCNALLGNLERVNWGGNDALKNQYAGEVRFIRAFAYLDLVRLFENVVLLDKPSSENLPQANPDDVYKLIADDLVFAIQNIPAVPYAQQVPAQHGRVTKWAAEALLARAFLFYTGYYNKTDMGGVTKQQVLDNLEDLIQNSGHDLVPDFATLWPAASVGSYAGERNIENIFNMKATYTSNYNSPINDMDGNQWMVMFSLRDGNYPPYGQGWGFASVNPKLWNAFSDQDTRKVASIISIADENLTAKGYSNAGQREYTGYFYKKYTNMSSLVGGVAKGLAEQAGGVNFQIGQYQDFIVMRYADVLLMAAELGSANAQLYFDKVRKRAYKANFAALPVTPANILEERRLEFLGEGIRYWDLLRQGVNVAASTIAETDTPVLSGGLPAKVTIKADNIISKKGFQQIPNTQITLSNGVLKQNAGW